MRSITSMVSTRAKIAAATFVAATTLVACGSGAVRLTPGGRLTPPSAMPTAAPSASAGAAAPAALAAITPAPGLPTIPPIGSTPGPAGIASPLSTPLLPGSIPIPAPSGSDLAALVAGSAPSQAYFASLAAPLIPAYPLADDAPKAVLGTIASFAPNGFAVDVAPAFDAAAVSTGVLAFAAGANAESAAHIAVTVSGATLDVVAGGFGALRVGMPIAVLGSGPANAFIATAVLGNFAPGPAAMPAVEREATLSPRVAPRTTVRRSNAVTSQTAFLITRTTGLPGVIYPNPPVSAVLGDIGCVHVEFSVNGAVGLGENASYPMLLQDVSDPANFGEEITQPLPVRLVNAPATGAVTYSINYGFAVAAGYAFSLASCPNVPKAVFPISVVVGGTAGQGFSAATTDTLPGSGNISLLTHGSCPFISLPFVASVGSLLLNSSVSPSLTLCSDFQLSGDAVGADASITNADISGVANTTDPSSGTTTFHWTSPLPGGDPGLSVTPHASRLDGSPQDNTLTLDNMTYNGNLLMMPTLQLSGFSVAFSPIAQNPFPVLSVFQQPGLTLAPPFQPVIGVSSPAAAAVTLHHATNTTLCGQVTSGNGYLGSGTGCSSNINFEFCRSDPSAGQIGQCPADASGTSGTVQISEGSYTGPFTVTDDSVTNGGCEDGTTQTYALTISPRMAPGPSASFTLSIGAQQLQNADTQCFVFIADSTGRSIQITLQFLSRP